MDFAEGANDRRVRDRKEELARFLHANSTRREKSMITVNSAEIPENLLASELFGHEKGAFTGATESRTGRSEEAHPSTIFLDEIGEMSLSLQPKLLRVLQEEELRRVAGKSLITVDFRLIVATNRSLWEEIAAGRFREDLFDRLRKYGIIPLREILPSAKDRPLSQPLFAEP